MIVCNLENPFFLDIFRALEADAHRRGYEVVVANTDYRPQRLLSSVHLMLERRPAGLAVIVSEMDPAVIRELASRGPLHGYGIVVRIQQVSEDGLRVEEGSLYPALHRVEQEGWIRSEWGVSETGRRARFYRLTAAGRKRMAEEEDKWRRLTQAVNKVLLFA